METDPLFLHFTRSDLTVVRHDGACGERRHCWRVECREAFGPFRTVELLRDAALAHCHHATYRLSDPLLAIEVAA